MPRIVVSVGKALGENSAAISAATLLSFSLIFFNPLLVYFSDPARLGDLPLDFVVERFFLATGVALAMALLAAKLGGRTALAVCFLCMVAFLYSYVVQTDFGLFRGNRFSNEETIFEAAKVAYWVEPIALTFLFFLVRFVFDRAKVFFAVFYSVLFLLLGVDLCARALDYLDDRSTWLRSLQQEPENLEFRFSGTRRNILLFVPDAGAGYLIPELMGEADRISGFDGFAYYRNTVSVGSYTLPSAGALIGGDRYLPDRINELDNKTIAAHILEAYNWLASTLSEHRYETTFVDPKFIACRDIEQAKTCVVSARYKKPPGSCVRGRGRAARRVCDDIERRTVFDEDTVAYFSIFKALPYSLKPQLYESDGWKNALESPTQLAASAEKSFDEFRLLLALPSLSSVEAEAPSQFIHLWNSELIAPFHLDRDCQPLAAGNQQMYSAESRVDATRCVLDALSTWFRWMKANGVYDNTKIIIAADHGAGDYGDDWYKGAVKPILLVKDFGSSGPLETSEILLQNSDVAAIICSGLGGCAGIKQDPTEHPMPDRTARYFVTMHGDPAFAKRSRRFVIRQVFEVQGNVYQHPDFQ